MKIYANVEAAMDRTISQTISAGITGVAERTEGFSPAAVTACVRAQAEAARDIAEALRRAGIDCGARPKAPASQKAPKSVSRFFSVPAASEAAEETEGAM